MQKVHFEVRAIKLPGFMQHRIGPSVQICGNSGLPFVEVPCLQQCNIYMKRKLQEWRTQKCNACFGAESLLRSTDLQTTRFQAAPYIAIIVNLRKLGASFPRGTVIAPLQSTYVKEGTGWRPQKCNPCLGAEIPLRSTGHQTTRIHAAPYRAVSANLRKVGASFC